MLSTTQAYLHDTLGIGAKVRAWAGAHKVPYFLQDAFEIKELTFLNRAVLLAIDRHPGKPGLASIRAQLDKLSAISGQPVIYVTDALASYERKRLIEQKVPFIVPGNQLYLPDLGIDLREYFRRRPQRSDTAFSPATQAMLITVLLRKPWRTDWEPAEVVAGLGYTAMTLSRALKELAAAGIGTPRTEGRTRWIHMERTAAETWEHAKPIFRNPVKKRFWARPTSRLRARDARVAGMSALARYSMLVEPQWPTYAISSAQWKTATQAGIDILPEPVPGACDWQLWQYSPALERNSETVDPLSLAISLQEEADERVQVALDELKARFPW